jgi:hypothetical protein
MHKGEGTMGHWTSRILPQSLNGVMMWIISFSMLFLLIRRYSLAKRAKAAFWVRETFVETAVILYVWLLTIVTFIIYVGFGGTLVVIETHGPTPDFLLPSTALTILVSLCAFGTFLSTLLSYLSDETRKHPSPRNFALAVIVIALFLGMRFLLERLPAAWDEPMRTIVTLITDVCVWGVLFPYIFAGAILYTIVVVRER